ncbi:MAG: 1-deoxy-D-xylulose-5-phosphate reductoisomerase [Clostridiales bacterium]|nr:1-deoxy-D-xylulose-5-phosphate reductoisomerase [Clostridiales bacterium]
MKNISILGSTGSIGTQALDVIKNNRDKFRIVALGANKNIDLLYKQILLFNPSAVSVGDYEGAKKLKNMLGHTKTEIFYGVEGLNTIAQMDDSDVVLTAVVGIAGLVPTLKAIEKNKIIALANKETLVAGGALIKNVLKKSKSEIIPVDSEHSAIFQCLKSSNNLNEVEKIILTASGGPFRGRKVRDLSSVSPQDAIKHPRWNMGKKISVDSATLMNKGFEIIEAHWLFDIGFDKIDVIIHPQSIIHSMVEYRDGSIIAQLGAPDMRNPILYALGYPKRLICSGKRLDLLEIHEGLTFEEPDIETFRSLKLAYDAGLEGGTMPVVLNAANEACVNLFLKNVIGFLDIPRIVENMMDKHNKINNPSLEEILETDRRVKSEIYKKYKVVF